MPSKRERYVETDRLLRAVLREEPAAADPCPPADDLAAYLERTLPAGARETMEMHLASCARCQDALALLAGMPDTATEPSPAVGWWRAGWKRWLVPVTAVASGVILYVALRPEPPSPTVLPSSGEVAASAPARAPMPLESTPVTAGAEVEGEGTPARQPSLQAGLPSQKTRTAQLEARANKGAREERVPGDMTRMPPAAPRKAEAPPAMAADAIRQQGAPAPVGVLADGRPAAPPVPPPPPAAAPATAASEAKKPEEQAEAVAGGAAGGVVGGVVRGAEGFSARQQATKLSAEAPARPESRRPLVVASPGNPPEALWRLEQGGRILRSSDGGNTWRLQRAGAGQLAAGSSPSGSVCWVAGADGLILRTVDGRAWEAVPFPKRTDLVAITAASALEATVTTRDGARFSTEDGGKTWR